MNLAKSFPQSVGHMDNNGFPAPRNINLAACEQIYINHMMDKYITLHLLHLNESFLHCWINVEIFEVTFQILVGILQIEECLLQTYMHA